MTDTIPLCGPGVVEPCQADWGMAAAFFLLIAFWAACMLRRRAQ